MKRGDIRPKLHNEADYSVIKPIQFEFAVTQSGALYDKWIVPWAEDVGKRSKGRLRVLLFPNESFVKQTEHWERLHERDIDIGSLDYPQYINKAPLAGFLSVLQGLSPGTKIKNGEYVLDIIGKKHLEDKAFAAFKILFYGQYAPNNIFWHQKQVKTLDDCMGLKLGYSGSKASSVVIKKLGMIPVPLSSADMSTALQRDVIDGILTSLSKVDAYNLAPSVKYATLNLDFASELFVIGMNWASWICLSTAMGDVFTESSAAFKKPMYDAIAEEERKGLDLLKNSGVTLDYLTATEKSRWMKSCASAADDWAKEMDALALEGTALINDARQMITEAAK
jgi:TRAP-type C4-dicarboxylate transport system substrate-binding protein